MTTEDYSTESNNTLRNNGPEIDPNDPNKSIEGAWDRHRFNIKMVNPANKRKYDVIVVGTGLAGASAAATMGELGYNVKAFCFQDSPRRAHSIAAQGGINAAKNYQGDGDSIYRLFYDTVKGGDFRSRESNVYRLAQISVNIIDQATFNRTFDRTLDRTLNRTLDQAFDKTSDQMLELTVDQTFD